MRSTSKITGIRDCVLTVHSLLIPMTDARYIELAKERFTKEPTLYKYKEDEMKTGVYPVEDS
jgi:hypothetical protein